MERRPVDIVFPRPHLVQVPEPLVEVVQVLVVLEEMVSLVKQVLVEME